MGTPLSGAIAGLALLLATTCPAAEIPERQWLESITLLAHSVRDQSVVLQMPDRSTRLLRSGEVASETYSLRLLKVLDRRVELVATHPSVADRKLRLWFDPRARRPAARIASSAPSEDEEPTERLFHVAPPVMQAVDSPADKDHR